MLGYALIWGGLLVQDISAHSALELPVYCAQEHSANPSTLRDDWKPFCYPLEDPPGVEVIWLFTSEYGVSATRHAAA